MQKYRDRYQAGEILAQHLQIYTKKENVLVLGLPRGGVPVAYEVAKSLNAPLDVFIVRKLGVPWHEELAFGAIASGDVIVFNEDLLSSLSLSKVEVEKVIDAERKELLRREEKYRDDRPFPDIKNKTVIVVDDGIATGATMRAAVEALRKMHAKKIVIAVPVAEKMTCETMGKIADEIVCPMRPAQFIAVGLWYDEFLQTEDEEVYGLLAKAQNKASLR